MSQASVRKQGSLVEPGIVISKTAERLMHKKLGLEKGLTSRRVNRLSNRATRLYKGSCSPFHC